MSFKFGLNFFVILQMSLNITDWSICASEVTIKVFRNIKT